ncbi:hypothetical protein CLV45_0471 [Hymenobacter chitinivorans DSM 11115]|uniref:Gliding motility-associated lipoprotein GldD n=2 Tax=Hymenobacter chitinivorans TaxID=89969 RepID=A0A2M9BM93_9BACT|nr:hypothetical protein CLV45_0471 [Hymenobacter chitinivorans DSM 11115]
MLPLASLSACNEPDFPAAAADLPNTSLRTVRLRKNLGVVTLRVPVSYDTLFSWTDKSGCTTYADTKYRFQPRQFPIAPETGYVYLNTPGDSVQQLTISHNQDVTPNYRKVDVQRARTITEQTLAAKGVPWYEVTVETIQGRTFLMTKADYSCAFNGIYKTAEASTIFRGVGVSLAFTLQSRQPRPDSITNNFFRDSEKLLRTIHLAEVPKAEAGL